MLAVVPMTACGARSHTPASAPDATTLVRTTAPEMQLATMLPMTTVEVVRDGSQPWQRVKLENPRLIVEANETEKGWRIRAPFGRMDRVLLSHGGRSILVDGRGNQLGQYDSPPRAMSRRWAIQADSQIVDLDTGETLRVEIGNEKTIVAALGPEFHSTFFATNDDQLWWTTLAAGGGQIWLARVDFPGPTTAQAYDLSDELVPSRGVWRSPGRLLVATEGDCRIIALGPDGESECITTQESPEWALRGDHLIPLQSDGDRLIDVRTGDVLSLQTPCPLTFLGVHQASRNALYICDNSDFGVYTPENSFLNVEVDKIATPIQMRPVAVGMRGQRFVEYAYTPTTKPIQIIVDMTGTVLIVPGKLLSSGDQSAILRDGDDFIAVDLETRTAMPLAPPCKAPSITHFGMDRFLFLCATVDASLPPRLQFTEDALVLESQEIVDVRHRVIYSVDGIVRTITDSAVFTGSAEFRHIRRPGPAVLVYQIAE